MGREVGLASLVLILAVAVAAIASVLHLPLAWLLGPLLVSAAFAIAGRARSCRIKRAMSAR